MNLPECIHGEAGGALAGCPACVRTATALLPDRLVIYRRGEAAYPGVCALDCRCRYEPGDPLAWIGEDADTGGWAREGCAEEAAG